MELEFVGLYLLFFSIDLSVIAFNFQLRFTIVFRGQRSRRHSGATVFRKRGVPQQLKTSAKQEVRTCLQLVEHGTLEVNLRKYAVS